MIGEDVWSRANCSYFPSYAGFVGGRQALLCLVSWWSAALVSILCAALIGCAKKCVRACLCLSVRDWEILEKTDVLNIAVIFKYHEIIFFIFLVQAPQTWVIGLLLAVFDLIYSSTFIQAFICNDLRLQPFMTYGKMFTWWLGADNPVHMSTMTPD